MKALAAGLRAGLRAGLIGGLIGGQVASAAVPTAAGAQQVCDVAGGDHSAPAMRFEDNADGTVTDKDSTLMWMRCTAGQAWSTGTCVGEPLALSWAEAQAAAADENRSGRMFFNDWRLPTLRELATIAERRCSNPRLDLSTFPNSPARAYWSASSRPDGGSGSTAYVLDFGMAGVQLAPKEDLNLLRLVRNAR